MPRLFLSVPIAGAGALTLPDGAARHAQVLRLQPGDALTVFDGRGGEWAATVLRMGRQSVEVEVGAHDPVDREVGVDVTLALGMPANDRMDALVEKATELGVAAIQPLITERSVLRLSGERAHKRVEHWAGVAVAAAEQSGRTRVPSVAPVTTLREWLAGAVASSAPPPCRWVLGFGDVVPLPEAMAAWGRRTPLVTLSGPEGGLSPAEVQLARQAGFTAVGLGPRVLRADTAPLAVMSMLSMPAAQPAS
jgi:16S rRNA (uracil1498-N3)-methyltransferase